jgi:hypothetical protein
MLIVRVVASGLALDIFEMMSPRREYAIRDIEARKKEKCTEEWGLSLPDLARADNCSRNASRAQKRF